jgi:hypothetical protein
LGGRLVAVVVGDVEQLRVASAGCAVQVRDVVGECVEQLRDDHTGYRGTAAGRTLSSSLHNRCHPFFTNSTEPLADADLTHRRHAIIDYVDVRVMPMSS